ncbi:hypothetical protein Q31a_02560 [Aureliella helgolandensis]|uniref:Uncharacterized protein n=1 Tax=Aureliella helgolandensis TaxID=2527968 RepID=A0A518G038_9BACT|nr:hypothetical protein Q31a_02560 [Aureliella helgolandensis]
MKLVLQITLFLTICLTTAFKSNTIPEVDGTIAGDPTVSHPAEFIERRSSRLTTLVTIRPHRRIPYHQPEQVPDKKMLGANPTTTPIAKAQVARFQSFKLLVQSVERHHQPHSIEPLFKIDAPASAWQGWLLGQGWPFSTCGQRLPKSSTTPENPAQPHRARTFQGGQRNS